MDPRTPAALAVDALTEIGKQAMFRLCLSLRDLRGASFRVVATEAATAAVLIGEGWSRAFGDTLADAVETLAESHGRPLIAAWIREQREALSRAETVPAPAGGNDSSNEMEASR